MKKIKSNRIFVLPIFGFGILALFSSGCTTNNTDPRAMNTSDMLFGQGRMERTLEQKRSELASLQQDLKLLDDELFSKRASLHAFEKELEDASKTDRELKTLLAQVKADKAKAESLSEQIMATQARIAKTEKMIESSRSNNERYLAELSSLKKECENLETQQAAVVKALNRTLKLRAEQQLRNM